MTINTAGAVSTLITERLQRIQRADGFETDIGSKIFRGRRKIGDDMVGSTGCISVLEGDDIVLQQLGGRLAQAEIEQRYGLVAYVPISQVDEEPNDAAHRAIRDMKRVIWAGDATFDRKVKQVKYVSRDIGPREDGVMIVLVVLEIGVVFVENLITP